jgi:hypothetical protein
MFNAGSFLVFQVYIFQDQNDYFGNTPIHWAIRVANGAAVKLLFSQPTIDLSIKNFSGVTPLQIALSLSINHVDDKDEWDPTGASQAIIVQLLQKAVKHKTRQKKCITI